ncbi:MAG: glycosyltransferase [Candidatus Omnitrophota bacterium]
MQKDLLSVVMVNFNHGAFLHDAIESVISQNYYPWELIVVDDGSTDNSLEIISEYQKKHSERIRVETHPCGRNLGIAESYRLGISLCRGEFVGFLEPDDLWSPENAGKKINILKSYPVGFVYSDVEPFGEPDIIRLREKALRLLAKSPSLVPFNAYASLAVINFIPTFSIVIARTAVFKEFSYLAYSSFMMSLDWFLWLQASLRQRFFFIPEKLVSWRLYQKSYYNSFLLRIGRPQFILWGLRYRWFILRYVVLPHKCGLLKKAEITALFFISFARRILMEIWERDC